MKTWMCWNCIDTATMTAGKRFESEEPKCSCGVDGTNPRHMSLIVECCTVHFDPPDPVIKGRGINKFACDGRPAICTPHETFTGDAMIVTCEECLTSDACVSAMKLARRYVPASADYTYCKSC